MLQRTAIIAENVLIAERTYRVRLVEPQIACQIRPGQFVMLRVLGTSDPLLGRPFALYDRADDAIDIVYLVVGKMTGQLAERKVGESVEVWGPLGNGFANLDHPQQVTLIAGGIGQTPFLAYTRELLGGCGFGGDPPRRRTARVNLYYGVRSAAFAAGVDDFEGAGASVHLASDDGSIGVHGFVTELLARDLPPGPWIGCGPEPMLDALIELAAHHNIPCHVSLETPMACGFGVCFSCVTKVKTADGWDFKRVCVDGPVFDAAKLVRRQG